MMLAFLKRVGGPLVSVVTRNEFYRDGFRNLIKIVILEGIIIIGLITMWMGAVIGSAKDDVKKAADAIVAKHGRIDLLVNSAGVNVPRRSWEDFDLDGWNKVVDINLNGVLYCMRAVLPAMRRQKDGCIINVASWAGRHVSKMTGPAYTTTKHAVLALTHSFNMDECVNGLRACCFSPGEVATPILDKRPVPITKAERARMAQSEDVGDLIRYVACLPPHVVINEVLINPTWNRGYVASLQRSADEKAAKAKAMAKGKAKAKAKAGKK